MQKILIIMFFISTNVLASFTTLTTNEVLAKQTNGTIIIDVRRVDEYNKYGVIPGSHKLTFFDKNGKYNAKKWLADLEKIVPTKATEFILVCAHANRTKTIGKFLNSETAYKNIYELDGGINYGWIDKGLATTKIAAKSAKPWYQFW
ncbi:MAG: rhodanese-like domain-containing protein [Candidatus Thioglobus sp.]|uniref:rhodanese-like domain-containing protein n=1 Tax=Candidatus Thioglobus sp. TaxID=2026721 RepID=UPI0026035B38|nr:rhodanese-like domain-containing protein [Candidatus Thioglobus sp.]MDC9727518.1 rhodanese-like domain-containing protein [Candidatus Thioglobus sp.]